MKKLKKAISVIMAIVCLGTLSGCSSSGNNLPMEERQFYLPHSSKTKLTDDKDDIIKKEGLKLTKGYNDEPAYTKDKVEINGVLYSIEMSFYEDGKIEHIFYHSKSENELDAYDDEFDDTREYFNKIYGYKSTYDGTVTDSQRGEVEWEFFSEDEEDYSIGLTNCAYDIPDHKSSSLMISVHGPIQYD